MSPRLIIQSITGSTPFEFYVCDIAETVCYYLGSVSSTSTSYFTLPPIFTTAPIVRLKMIDANGCEIKKDLSCDFTCGFDLIIEACGKVDVRLRIYGTGSRLKYLQSIAGPKVEFLGRISDEERQKQMEAEIKKALRLGKGGLS